MQSVEEVQYKRAAKQKVIECIDFALSRYGPSVSSLLYHRFEQDRGLPKEAIPLHPGFFEMEIKSIFGPGARHIRDSIIGEVETSFLLHSPCETVEEAVSKALKTANLNM